MRLPSIARLAAWRLFSREPAITRELRIGIAAIFKNESPYILEWIAYHRALGVTRFYIADNNSDDGSTELLAALAEIGVVEHIPFPGEPGQAPQMPAYAEIIRRHQEDVDWLAFIDADEFLLPTDGARSIVPFLTELNDRPEVGVVAVNWANYGSSGHLETSNEAVVRRFTRRSETSYVINHHYKSLVRTSAAPAVRGSPHLLGTSAKLAAIHPNGMPLVNHPRRGEGMSAEVIWDRVRLNHFVVKSQQEYDERKASKGRADVVGLSRTESYFTQHDRNEIDDPTPTWLVDKTEAEVKRLIGELAELRQT